MLENNGRIFMLASSFTPSIRAQSTGKTFIRSMEFSGKMPGPLHEVGLPSSPEAVPEAPADQGWVSEVLEETSQPPAKATKAGVFFLLGLERR